MNVGGIYFSIVVQMLYCQVQSYAFYNSSSEGSK
jgi:hypothetical protein